ncbi:MAG: polysaccharide biosynthesis tyrosine autokinase [Paracoccaceae bacterium]
MSEIMHQDTDSDDEIDLMELFHMFYRRKFTVLFFTVLATAVGVMFALFSTPIYQADALVQLEEKSSGGLAVSAELSDLLGASAPQSVAEIEILNARMILGKVIDDLNLDWSAEPKRLPMIGNFLTRFSIPDPQWGIISNYAWQGENIVLGLLDVPESMFGEPIVLMALGGDKFTVNIGEGDPLEGRVGTTLHDELSGLTLRVDHMVGAAGREFIVQQDSFSDTLKDLRKNLSISEKGKKSSILRLVFLHRDPEQATRILAKITEVYLLQNLSRNAAEAESSLAFINEQIPVAQEQVEINQEALNAFMLSQESVDLTFETRSLLEQVVEIEGMLNALVLEEQELQKRYTQSHPAYQTLLDNRGQLEKRLTRIRAQTVDLPETQQQVLRLRQDLEVSQQIYLQMVNRAQELSVIKAGTLGNIRIIDSALAATKAVKPNKKMIVLLAGMLGLVFSFGFVLLRSYMTQGVEGTEEIEQIGVPVYATVSKVGNGEFGGAGKKDALKILAKVEPTSLAVEALRSLRTSLHFGMLEAKSSLLMITSSRPDEGKSFIAVNLATVMAQAGQNICLVDTDIRRGYLRRYFNVKKTAPGLTDVLAGEALIDEVIQQDPDSGLHFIPAGKYPPNPSELLMHKNFADVVDYLDKRFDMTVLDAPPVLAVTDPVIMAKYAGMILLTVRHQLTNIAEVKAVQRMLEANGIKITGAVLNGYDAKKSKYAYGATSYQYEYKSRDA